MKYKSHNLASSAVLGAMTPAERAAGRYMRALDGHTQLGGGGSGGGLDFKALEEHFDRHHGEVKGLIEQTKTKIGALDERISGIEQAVAQVGRGGGGAPSQTLGAQFIEHESLKDLITSQTQRGRAEMQVKATITTATTDAAGSAGGLIAPFRDATVVLPRRRLTVRSLLPVVNISSGSVEVPRMKARNNNAAPVAEGEAKPGSDMQIELETIPARVIAHWMKASRQVLDDAPQLRDIIDGELLNGLAEKEEDQILNGSGVGQNLYGLMNEATAYAAPIVIADATSIDTIGLAMLQSALALHPATGIVLHPADWLRMQLLKDADGNYILGEPQAATEPRLWGVPVVSTPAMGVGNFLVGNFVAAATLYDRWTARVEVATENEDDFVKNLLTLLAEERVALAVKQPLALTKGAFA